MTAQAPRLACSVGNKNTEPMVFARVMHHGKNDYRIQLVRQGWPEQIHFDRATNFGTAFTKARRFGELSAQDLAFELNQITNHKRKST